MYSKGYVPWEHAPRHLTWMETIDPMHVIADLFEIDSLANHAAKLKEWRDHVVGIEPYANERNGPVIMVDVWLNNLRLIEAMHLLFHERQGGPFKPEPVTEEQLADEKKNWISFPANLSVDQLTDPYRVIESFFSCMQPAWCRDQLYEWLRMALSRHLNVDHSITAADIIMLYERLLTLHSAAWLLCQRYGPRPHLKSKPEQEHEHQHTSDADQASDQTSTTP